MCLSCRARRYKKKRNWVTGYKILRRTPLGWRSQLSSQKWEFAKLIKAIDPRITKFRGDFCDFYENGIHAWKKFSFIKKHRVYLRSKGRIVKVLLFGVTHRDSITYRADAAIIVEVLDRSGHRIPW